MYVNIKQPHRHITQPCLNPIFTGNHSLTFTPTLTYALLSTWKLSNAFKKFPTTSDTHSICHLPWWTITLCLFQSNKYIKYTFPIFWILFPCLTANTWSMQHLRCLNTHCPSPFEHSVTVPPSCLLLAHPFSLTLLLSKTSFYFTLSHSPNSPCCQSATLSAALTACLTTALCSHLYPYINANINTIYRKVEYKIIIIFTVFNLLALPNQKRVDPRSSKKASSNKYGYRTCRTQAQVLC